MQITKKIGILNLMPLKQETEKHFEDIFKQYSPIKHPIELVFLKLDTHVSKNTSAEYLSQYYKSCITELTHHNIDALIVTGAPVELLYFEEVMYWQELTHILDLVKNQSLPLFTICWGAQAALFHYYQIPKDILNNKASGVFEHHIHYRHRLLKNLQEPICIPVSRHTTTPYESITNHPNVDIVLHSKDVGVCVLTDKHYPFVYVTGHFEYSCFILRNEYLRDMQRGLTNVTAPVNYNLDNPVFNWHKNACTFYHNWVNQFIMNAD